MRVVLQRILTHHIASTFIPTLFIIVISELTLFIDVRHFEVTIMVALTSLLVMYTLYQSISETLPNTAYMKMIDIWLFCGMIFPFIMICVLTILDYMMIKEKNQTKNINSCSKEKKQVKKKTKNKKKGNLHSVGWFVDQLVDDLTVEDKESTVIEAMTSSTASTKNGPLVVSRSSDEYSKKFLRSMQIILPTVTGILLLSYWVYGIYMYNFNY